VTNYRALVFNASGVHANTVGGQTILDRQKSLVTNVVVAGEIVTLAQRDASAMGTVVGVFGDVVQKVGPASSRFLTPELQLQAIVNADFEYRARGYEVNATGRSGAIDVFNSTGKDWGEGYWKGGFGPTMTPTATAYYHNDLMMTIFPNLGPKPTP